MNPKTIKVKQTAVGELFACDNLQINSQTLDIPTLVNKTQFQSATTSPSVTLFSGTVNSTNLESLIGNLECFYLETANITPSSGTTITITQNLSNSVIPNSSAAGALICVNKLNVSNSGTFNQVVLKVLRTLVSSGSEIHLTIGTNINFNSVKLAFNWTVTDSSNTVNYGNFGLSSGTGIRVWPNFIHILNSLFIADIPVKPTWSQQNKISTVTNMTSFYNNFYIGPPLTTTVEAQFVFHNFIFPESGQLFMEFSGNSTFTQLFTYTGVTRNSADTGAGGTPIYVFMPATGTTAALANRSWRGETIGMPIFLGKYTDTTTQRMLDTLTIKMYRFDEEGTKWVVMYQGYINSYTIAGSTPPFIQGSGVIESIGTSTPRYYRFRMKDSKTFGNVGTTWNNRWVIHTDC